MWKLLVALMVLVSLALAFIPTWVFLAIRSMLEPDGFWQQLVVYGIGVWFMGGLQVILLIGWAMVWITIWAGPKK